MNSKLVSHIYWQIAKVEKASRIDENVINICYSLYLLMKCRDMGELLM